MKRSMNTRKEACEEGKEGNTIGKEDDRSLEVGRYRTKVTLIRDGGVSLMRDGREGNPTGY